MIDDPSIYKEECKPEEIVVTSSVLPRKVSKEAKKKGVSKPVPVCPYGATCYRYWHCCIYKVIVIITSWYHLCHDNVIGSKARRLS